MTERYIKSRPGILTETKTDINPSQIDEFRLSAGYFVPERKLTKEEIDKISEDNSSPLVRIEFKDFKLTRMRFPSGSIMELYSDGRNVFRVNYDFNSKILTTVRYSTP